MEQYVPNGESCQAVNLNRSWGDERVAWMVLSQAKITEKIQEMTHACCTSPPIWPS
jgi:hypothetical protein